MTQQCEVVVVGRGLIGSAAARHLAEAGISTALVGAGEPCDYEASDGPFASHYDEGRITRITASNPIWSELATRSIGRYCDIAERSGIEFHSACRLAYSSNTAETDMDDAVKRGADVRLVTQQWLRETTGIQVPRENSGPIVFEGAPAGLINPRRLVAAQTALA
ncbi:MAG: FAD-dependent oxidoreductase, partial [Acidimicrobiales bacterium]